MSGFFHAVNQPINSPNGDSMYIENTASAVITKRTIDNITYTIKSRSSEDATQTLKDKLEACIARDIAKLT